MVKVIKKIVIIVLVVIALYIVAKNVFVYIIREYGGYTLEERTYNGMITGYTEIDPFNEFDAALSKYEKWDNLFVTNNFKQKFKNYRGIINDIDNYQHLLGGYDYEEFDKKVIYISAEKKKTFLDFFNSNYDDISTEFYFDYKVDDKGWLDDVTLLKRVDVLSITGEPVSE